MKGRSASREASVPSTLTWRLTLDKSSPEPKGAGSCFREPPGSVTSVPAARPQTGEDDMPLSDEDIQAIRTIHRGWLHEELAGNAQGVLEFCTDDVVWIPASGPLLRGKAEIRRWLRQDQPDIKSLRVSDPEIEGSGSFAYKLSTYSSSFVTPGGSEVVTVEGAHLWILRKDRADRWLVALLTWTSTGG